MFMFIPDTNIDTDTITNIIASTAITEIMPLFQSLGEDDIREKDHSELVTVADIATEQALSLRFKELLPESEILGEESVAENAALLDLIFSQGPVWIIDPIDGTGNFTRGTPCFAVMVAFLNKGKVQAGWIHDPISQKTCTAVLGQGAWCDGKQLHVAGKGKPVSGLQGSLGHRLSKSLKEKVNRGEQGLPETIRRYRCCGREYMDLAFGKIQYLQYGIDFKPWDHAPGVLIANEAGYHNGFLEDNRPYDVADFLPDGYLMIAPDVPAWQTLRNVLWD